MVSDFITESDGYLRLTQSQSEYATARAKNQNGRMAQEYGESREGYWTSENFMKQISIAVEIAEPKYPSAILDLNAESSQLLL